ncbi:hypothetical protein [Clostridium sp.]|uniref:hypothetical protein n=1 Tax=Clostridium sp. TaxID=1506 RepID=UPI003F4157D1
MSVKNLSILNIVMLFFMYLILTIANEKIIIVFSLGIILALLILISKGNWRKGLSYTVGLVVLIGVLAIIIMIIRPEYLKIQTNFVITYGLFSMLVFLMWFTTYSLNKTKSRLEELEKKLIKFEKEERKSNILTMEEFEDRKKFILKGSSRRKEKVYCLEVFITSGYRKSFYKSLFDSIGASIYKSIRENYDIVAEKDSKTYIVLLQNTTEEGIGVVIKRITKNMNSTISLEKDIVNFKSYEVGEKYDS